MSEPITEASEPLQPEPSERPDREQGTTPAKKIATAATSVAADTATPRRAAEVNELLRDADAVFREGGVGFGNRARVEGNVVGRDYIVNQYAGAAVATLTPYRLDPALVALAGAYVAHENYADLKEHSRTRRLVILQGPPKRGRSGAALRLLADCGYREVYGYPPETPVDALAGDLRNDTGYLLEELADTAALRALVLNDLNDRLAKANSFLAVTVDDGSVYRDPGVRGYIFRLGPPPALRRILAEHLRHHLGSNADGLLSDPQLLAVFDEEVTADSGPGRVADFAVHAADLLRRGRLRAELLRARLRGSVIDEVTGWFHQLEDDPRARCLAIALALLDGLPYEAVTDAADSLHRRLTGTATAEKTATSVNPFGNSRTDRIAKLHAQVVPARVTTRIGPVPAEVASYLDPAYPRILIDLVWREYDGVHQQFLGWLRDLGDHTGEAVRIRAATAVGLLAVGSFDHLHRAVLRPWATSDSARKREMAAYALREPGGRPELSAQVLRLVNEWTASDSWQLRAAAARVHGAALGRFRADQALQQLTVLAATDDSAVAFAIAYSLAELIDADHALAPHVIGQVAGWMADRQRLRDAPGELAFLILAADLVAPYRPAATDACTSDWPLLLSLAQDDSGLRQLVADGWRQTLNGRLFAGDARRVAGRWALLVEPHRHAREAVASMLALAADAPGDRTTRIVRDLARRWTDRVSDVHAPYTAETVLRALAGRRGNRGF